MFNDVYSGARVLVTGHTGFKGAWLSLWLKKLGATVGGYSLEPPTNPNLYSLVRPAALDTERFADIRDFNEFQRFVTAFRPDVIFHLAAQPLVRRSYDRAAETFLVNCIGTLNVLEAVRQCKSPAALVLVTTDKCYENKEWHYSYRENDPLGGIDPYSSSKAAAELVIHSWRESFFKKSPDLGPVASARAGNVIGGGDYAEDRLVPDAVRAILGGKELIVRNPKATRPWQHVLDCLSGYLTLGAKLRLEGKTSEAQCAFNFGPGPDACVSVGRLVEEIFRILPGRYVFAAGADAPREAGRLNLAIAKAANLLGWSPTWRLEQAIEETMRWYEERHCRKNPDMLSYSLAQIDRFEQATRSGKSRRE